MFHVTSGFLAIISIAAVTGNEDAIMTRKSFVLLSCCDSLCASIIVWGDRLGTLEPGKLADIIAVEGDPLEQIQDLAKVRFVMVEGRRYDHLSFR